LIATGVSSCRHFVGGGFLATFKRFEDIQAWQKAREVTRSIYRVTKNVQFAKDFGLRDQIRRASVSIMANIAEGFARRSDKDFAHFLNISRSSVAEVQSHLYVALDEQYVDEKEFREIYTGLEETSKMIFALVKHLVLKH
jgi:four helix bundle protein